MHAVFVNKALNIGCDVTGNQLQNVLKAWGTCNCELDLEKYLQVLIDDSCYLQNLHVYFTVQKLYTLSPKIKKVKFSPKSRFS